MRVTPISHVFRFYSGNPGDSVSIVPRHSKPYKHERWHWQGELLPRLESIKHYFLLDRGDFFEHFLDCAEGELDKIIPQVQFCVGVGKEATGSW